MDHQLSNFSNRAVIDCPKSGPGPPGPRIVGPGPVDVRTGLQVQTRTGHNER